MFISNQNRLSSREIRSNHFNPAPVTIGIRGSRIPPEPAELPHSEFRCRTSPARSHPS